MSAHNKNSVLVQALNYAEKGHVVVRLYGLRNTLQGDNTTVPCSCDDLACDQPGFHPNLGGGKLGGTWIQGEIESWFQKDMPNIGIFPAASGLFAIQIDEKKNGLTSLTALESKFGSLPTTQRITRKGMTEYILFKDDKRLDGIDVETIAPGLTILHKHTYLPLPPSQGFCSRDEWYGKSEAERGDNTLRWVGNDLVEAPEWLLQILEEKSKARIERIRIQDELRNKLIQTGTRYWDLFGDPMGALKARNSESKYPLSDEELRVIHGNATSGVSRSTLTTLPLNDLGNYQRFLHLYRGNFYHVKDIDRVATWQTNRWVLAGNEVAERMAIQVVQMTLQAIKEKHGQHSSPELLEEAKYLVS